jgi:Uma2 family endonuclease
MRSQDDTPMTAILIDLKPIPFTDDQFFDLCQANQLLNLELTSEGELVIMPPVGGESGRSEASLSAKVYNWNESSGLGYVFSSSTVFKLPNGAKRSPDVAWIESSRWNALSLDEKRKFPPIVPDFVIELRSASDPLKPLQQKMQEYLDNGVGLGFLIDPKNQTVEIYRPDQRVELRSLPTTVTGELVMPGFELSLDRF